MKIEDFKHINVLFKLLGKIRYSDKLDSDDIDFYATSPLIVEIHEWLKKEWIEKAIEKGFIKASSIDDMIFEFDSHVGQMLRNRIENWNTKMVEIARNWNEKDIKEYACLMVEPLNYQDSEIDKLIDYIKHRLYD